MKEHFCGRTISLHVHRHSPGTELRPQPRRHALQPPQGIFRAKSQFRGVSLDRPWTGDVTCGWCAVVRFYNISWTPDDGFYILFDIFIDTFTPG